jgi:peptidoglycan-associated lipoprotein
MDKKRLCLVFALAALVVLLPACRKKAPTTPAQAAAAPQAAATAPSPPTGAAAQLDPLAGDLATVNEFVRREGLLGAVHFDYDRAELRPQARERLARNAEFLRNHPEFVVSIEGHCDERGTSAYNLALGERRAGTALDYIVGLGISEQRLRTLSYGKERPACMEPTESCWSRNRRADFTVVARSGAG